MAFVVLSVSLLILAVGVGLGIVILGRNRGSAQEILNQRLASAEISVEELDFQIESEGGLRASGALTVDRLGTFTVTCSVPGHADAGMRATLVVQ